ncbi:MAG TPA: transglutaminaseTgpA domain-containing protein, partial [Pseudonocardiaceae bacterium]|nr:transglutaminaseTgpA domain-containing protein [Pseudonocardiaceae bacterium]
MSSLDPKGRSSGVERRITGVALCLTEAGLGALACASTTLLYASYFTGVGYLPVLLGAATGGAVLAGITGFRRWRAAVTGLTAVLGFVGLAVVVVIASTVRSGVPPERTAAELGTGLVRGWARMLTVSLPAEVTGELLVTPAVITWSASFLATTLVLRTRWVLVPLLPPLLALVVGLLFTAVRTDSGLPVTAVFLVTVLTLILVRSLRLDSTDLDATGADRQPHQEHQELESASGRRLRLLVGRAVAGVPLVLGAALVGFGGAGLVPVATGAERFDLREVIPLPLRLQDTITPLATLKAQLRAPQQELFTVRITTPDTGADIDRVRTAVLDSFDGALWSSQDRFLLAGRTLAPDLSVTDSHRVGVHISITRLDGPYLPAVGWPVHIDRPGLGFSSTSGVLVSNNPLNGLSYDIVGQWHPRIDEALRDATPNLTEEYQRYSQLPPGLPPELRATAAELTSPTSTPYTQLLALENYLQQ